MEEAIHKIVSESLDSGSIKLEIQRQLEEGRKKLHEEVAAELEREKQFSLVVAQRKEVCILLCQILMP